MDVEKFDTLTRSLAAMGSRRRVLGAVVTGSLGLCDLVSPDDAAGKERKKKACPPCRTRKKGKCKGTRLDGTPCSSGTCQGGRCVAPSCDPNVCGEACPCAEGAVCTDGQCVNGKLAVGATCTPSQPRGCASGMCGCYEASCTCRNSTCRATFSECTALAQCCTGPCAPAGPLLVCYTP